MRPTTSSMTFPQRPSVPGSGLEQVDADPAASVESADDGAQRGCGPPVPSDDLAEVVRVHPNLEHAAAPEIPATYADLVRVIDDSLDEVLERFFEHRLSPRPYWLLRSRRPLAQWCPQPLAGSPQLLAPPPLVRPSHASLPCRWSPRPLARPTPALPRPRTPTSCRPSQPRCAGCPRPLPRP